MQFKLIDIDSWDRREYYDHYMKKVICTYSLTVDLNITNLIGLKLYPTMLWLLTDTVNEMEEFRTSLSPDGIGIFDSMHPSYTVFNQETKRFCCTWTNFDQDQDRFVSLCQNDIEHFSKADSTVPVFSDMPTNVFSVSMIPWVNFTAFNLNIHNGGDYLLPIFTLGKFRDEHDKRLLPLAIQAHHAVCDGYHIGVFIKKLQAKIDLLSVNT